MNKEIEAFVDEARSAWGPLTTERVETMRALVAELARTPLDVTDGELYRDSQHGFVLLAYSEREGQYRVPHDHGRGWVVYAVVRGEVEMGTYARPSDASARLVRRDRTRMHAGDCQVYLPGDIHDTRCISKDAQLLRLTSCDLKVEEREGRLTRYREPDDAVCEVRTSR